ncbi:hypothetical protein fh0823_17620 [Francisella halioticida]|nr:hypothetical protein [Francisella halioticida]BCD91623.1 hypothetical protein fh0823_17620 [Francisella halioticida]
MSLEQIPSTFRDLFIVLFLTISLRGLVGKIKHKIFVLRQIYDYIKSIKHQYSNLLLGAANFIRDIDLAIFIARVGITAGPQAITAIKEDGLTLFFLGQSYQNKDLKKLCRNKI